MTSNLDIRPRKNSLSRLFGAASMLAGQLVVSLMTEARGSANEKAKQELGWAPQYASWRDGFRDWAKTAGQGRAA